MLSAILDESKELGQLVGQAPACAVGPAPCPIAVDHLDCQAARTHRSQCWADSLPRVLRRGNLFFRVDNCLVLLFADGEAEAVLTDRDLEPKLVVCLRQEQVTTPFGLFD